MKRFVAMLVAAAVLALPAVASAVEFEVDTLDDLNLGAEACTISVACSFRDAIDRANETPEPDEITFSELFAGEFEPESELPDVLWPLTIDATTAADYSDAGHPVLLLSGEAISETEKHGLEFGEDAGGSVVKGLAVGGFRIGIFTYAEAGAEICANYVGVETDGKTALPNTYAGISTGATGAPTQGARIGGAGCGGNLISGNAEFGILEAGEDTVIKGNQIGVDADGEPLPNGDPLQVSAGIEVNAAAVDPVIGGAGAGEGNTIANTAGPGIRVRKNASSVAIRGNSIYANEDSGIEFSEGEPPFYTFVEAFAGTTWFGPLSGADPDTEYEVDLFTNSQCDSSYKGEGEVFLGTTAVTTDGDGEAEWGIDAGSLAGIDAEAFTATVTATATGETSRFSDCSFTRPDTTLETTPPALTNETAATFGFSGSDLGHINHFQCYIDDKPGEICGSPHVISGLADGPHTFEVTAFDGSGFFTIPPQSYTWTVDTTGPQTSIESGPPAETTATDASFSFSGSDPGAGVERLECSLDGAAFAPCTSPIQVSGLGTGSHGFAVRGVDKLGNVSSAPATYSWKVGSRPAQAQQVTPENGESVAVAPTSGKVFVTLPGQKKPAELKEGQTIPVGSIVDATQGKVTLTSVNKAGEAQTAVFYGGKFLVAQQEGSGLVVLKLRGSLKGCPKAGSSGATASGKKGRRLWGSGKGKFRTEGNYGSATVRGTIWLTEDRCTGTFFKVRRGVVTIRDFSANETFPLGKGKTYFAKP